jgi:hypothetical protein
MTGNLVDNEDYPRQDIDVYAVRFARNRIICKLLMPWNSYIAVPACHCVRSEAI